MNMFEQSHIIQCAPHEIIQFNNNLNLSLDKCLSKVHKVSAEQNNKRIKKLVQMQYPLLNVLPLNTNIK